MSPGEPKSAPRRAGLAAAALLVAFAGSPSPAFADEGGPQNLGGPTAGQGASVAGPILAPAAAPRDGRMDCRVESQEVPYRVEPKIDGHAPNPWDLPPEKPDPRDFEETDTFDALATPHYTIHEDIWNNVEDLITSDGFTRYGGLAYVPFWARNAIRYGPWSLFPFVHAEAVWHTDLGQDNSGEGTEAFEFMTSAGLMAEYFAGPRTKVKAALRADYRTYSDVYDDAWTYVAGVSIEHQLGCSMKVDAGVETERAMVPYDLETSGGVSSEEPLFQREKVFADLRWDRFLSCDWCLDVGGSYSWVDEVNGVTYGGDYQQLDLYARASVAIMRHEGFAYAQYGYSDRDAEGTSSDLDASHTIRLGVSGIQPFGRTRRIVGDVWVGYQWEEYTASTESGSVGQGGQTSDDMVTFGGSLTYRPTAYTSSYLSFEHGTSFSAIANYNTTDAIYLGITQNLSHRLVGRLALSGTRVEPEDDGNDSWLVGAGAGLRYILTDNLDLSADYQYEYRFQGAGYGQADGSRIAIGATLQLR